MTPLLLIGILVALDRKKQVGKKDVFFTALYLVLLAVTSMSSSFYVVACGLAPVFMVYLGYKFLRWERISKYAWLLISVSVFCALVGMKVNDVIMGGTRTESMVLSDVYHMLSNVSSCFFGFFELMGGITTESGILAVSVDGVLQVAKSCLMMILLICGAVSLKKCLKKQGNLREGLLLSVFLWNYFILNICYVRAGSSTYEYRYHLIGILPLFCVTAIVFVEWFQELQRKQQQLLFACVFVTLFALNGMTFRELFIRGEQNQDLKELCQYAKEMDVEAVYLHGASDHADICRFLDDDRLYLFVGDDGLTWAYDYYSKYEDAPMLTENVLVVVTEEDGDKGDSYVMGGHTLVRFDFLGTRSLYYVVPE